MLQDTTAILLAAGESKRFGPDNKLLQGINGKPILHKCVDTLLQSNIQRIVVITGHNDIAIEQSLAIFQTPQISVHFNKHFQLGQSSSLHAGIRYCDNSSAILVCLADMPHVQPATINRLLQSAQINPDSSIIAPQFNDKRGNPVLFKRSVFTNLLRIKGDTGARQFIEQHPELLTLVSVEDQGIHQDYDLPGHFSP